MDSAYWKNKTWIQFTKYPNGFLLSLGILVVLCIGICVIVFGYRYPVYKNYYGIVKENQNNILEVAVLLDEIDEFQEAIKKNNEIELIDIDSNIQIESGQSVVLTHVRISNSNLAMKQLIKNNIIPLKLKIKTVSFWDELYQMLVKGV